MKPTGGSKKPSAWLNKFTGQLRNPQRFRAFVTGAVLVGGYCFLYIPLNDRIVDVKGKLSSAKKSLALAEDVEKLRKQYQSFEKRLPNTDSKEWAAYLLNGLRQYPLRMLVMDSRPLVNAGPYKVVTFRFGIEGKYPDICKFLSWLEGNERFIRVDSICITSAQKGPTQKSSDVLVVQITILGLTS